MARMPAVFPVSPSGEGERDVTPWSRIFFGCRYLLDHLHYRDRADTTPDSNSCTQLCIKLMPNMGIGTQRRKVL